MYSDQLQPGIRIIIAMAATVASLTLLVQVALPFPHATLTLDELVERTADLKRYYILDTVYTFAWLVAWAGIAAIISAKSKWLTVTATVLTFLGMMLGLAKNGWTNALIQAYANGTDITSWWLLFKAVGGMSFICVFTGIVLASVALFGRHILGKISAFLGVTLIFTAALGTYIPSLFILIFLWGLLWTLTVTALLWIWAKDPQKASG